MSRGVRRRAILKQRLHEELAIRRSRRSCKGTVRLLSTRMQSKEEDVRRLDQELSETANRVHEHTQSLGAKMRLLGS